MEQVILGGYYDALNVAATEYNGICGGHTWHADEDNRAQAVSTAGTIRNLRVELDDVPGTGTYTFTLYRAVGVGAWGDTTLTCTVAADGTIASDTEHDVTVAAGDVICLKCAPDSPDNARYATWTVEFEGDTANESLILTNNTFINSATWYGAVMGNGGSATENWMRQVCPTSGVIKNLYAQIEEDPGTDPDAYRFTLRVNGANSDDGVGNPLQVTITADARTGNDTTHEITVSAGDILTVMGEPLNAPSLGAAITAMGMTFVADTDGESLIMGSRYDPLSTSATEYGILVGYWNFVWSATEAERYQLAQECVLKKLYMLLDVDPGGTDKYTFTVRLEGASPESGLVVEVAGGSTTGNDTTNSISVSDGEVVNMMVVPTDTPAVGSVYWGLVCSTITLFTQSVGGGAITPTGTLGAVKQFVQGTGDGAITPAGVLSLVIKLTIGNGAITPAGALNRIIKLAVGEGAITPTGALSTIKKLFQSVGQGAITPVGTLVEKILLAVGSGAITPTGALNRLIKITIGGGAITPTGILGKILKIAVGEGTITPIGVLGRLIKTAVGGGAITPTGALNRLIKITTGGNAVTPTGALNRTIKLIVGAGTVTPTSTLGRVIRLTVGQGTITPVGNLIPIVLRWFRRVSESVQGESIRISERAQGSIRKINASVQGIARKVER